ncbi:MAG: ABC-F family ATP-binding cassette domain-containing protein [Chloroflexi bacterium]|nr:MAG: ABC-F family ATP-binding cassette domain-containing protein [Chloroflexota bacterium]
MTAKKSASSAVMVSVNRHYSVLFLADEYTQALMRFDDKGFYQIEEQIERELENFQLTGVAHRPFSTLSGGQKRLVEVVKIMHSDAHLALVDEPTNHMDYVAKAQYVEWMKTAREAMLVITHDRDVLNEVRLEETSRAELGELQAKEKPTFWIDKESAANLNYKVAAQYDKFKAKNIRMNMKSDESRSKHILVNVKDLSLGYGDAPLFDGVNIDLREGEALELRGRNGAGKTTVIKAILQADPNHRASIVSSSPVAPDGADEGSSEDKSTNADSANAATVFSGDITLDRQMRIGVYEQEVSPTYFDLPLADAVERMYLDRGLAISETKVRGLLASYLFTEGDGRTPLSKLSGGQKARFQLISMLANEPQLLILDEPTNHLDLPSIEELETALAKYSGAIMYVSHDGFFRQALGGDVVQVGAK